MTKAILAVIAAAASAASASATEPRSVLAKDAVVLDLRNIDLATVGGQRVLAIRMDQAARAVCGDRLATVHLDLEPPSRSGRGSGAANIRSQSAARRADARRPSATPVLLALR